MRSDAVFCVSIITLYAVRCSVRCVNHYTLCGQMQCSVCQSLHSYLHGQVDDSEDFKKRERRAQQFAEDFQAEYWSTSSRTGELSSQSP